MRTALLLGAGASRFASFPAVDSFFQHIWPQRSGLLDELCSQLARMISAHEGTQESHNWPAFNAEKLFGWLEILDKAHTILQVDGDTNPIVVSNNRGLQMRADELLSRLKGEIVKAYATNVDPHMLANAPYNDLLKLLDMVVPDTDPLHIFTTNYDGLLEQLFQFWHDGNSPLFKQFRTITGFSSDRPGRWQTDLLDEKPISGVRLIKLAKLHGSVTWKKNPDGRPVETGWSMPTGHDSLLYFGYKSIPEEEPFISLHQLLKSVLLEYELLIAIGFRFGDPFIYELFDLALRANGKLQVVYCLTRAPESGSPLARLTAKFGSRVHLLTGPAGNPVPFNHQDFQNSLSSFLTRMSAGAMR